jgi:hypothetical protein
VAKLTKRAHRLSKKHQRKFLSFHIPSRIEVIEACLAGREPNYGKLAAAAIFSRSIAAFLGFATKSGQLYADPSYFRHAQGQSWEVKLSDIDGGACLTLADLTARESEALENGINETNLAFAHLTYWDAPAAQDSHGGAIEDYRRAQLQRIRVFAQTVIDLFRRFTKGLPK